MPIYDTGPLIDGLYSIRSVTRKYSQPTPDPVSGVVAAGAAFNIFSRASVRRTAQAVQETRITDPAIGAVVGIYDPVLEALIAGES